MESYNKNLEQAKVQSEAKKLGGGRSGRVWGGIVLLIIGSLLLADRLGLDLPRWFFSWQMVLMAVGLFIGARSNFKSWGWLIPFGIGFVSLADRILWHWHIIDFNMFWPAVIIVIGLIMIFRPKRKKDDSASQWAGFQTPVSEGPDQGEVLESVAIFGSTKKNVLSKNFRGGDVTSFFGGSELNFMQADINGVVILDVTSVFGGAKLIVPSNWTVKSDVVTIFGGIDDKRQVTGTSDPNKVLVLDGTVIFGGMEIKSY